MTWLKRRIKELGLHRSGANIVNTPISLVKEAIQVCEMLKNQNYLPDKARFLNCSVKSLVSTAGIGYRQMGRILQEKHNFCGKR